jgi:hypothetical protein
MIDPQWLLFLPVSVSNPGVIDVINKILLQTLIVHDEHVGHTDTVNTP